MKVYNPANGKLVGTYPLADTSELEAAIAAGRRAQKKWNELSVGERNRRVKKLRAAILVRRDDLAECIADCTGKTLTDALASEVLPSAVAIGYYCRTARRFLKNKKLKRSSLLFFNKSSYLQQCPLGVVGIISPWNYPFAIPFHEVLTALVCGNAVLLKLAGQAQPLAAIFGELFAACELPAGLLQILNIPGKAAGPGFLKAGVDKLFFTGSVSVGKQLMELAAKTLTPVSLELGGNDGMIVTEYAAVERAAEGALWAGFSNCGQSCGGVERIYVHEKVYDSFMAALEKRVNMLRQGPNRDYDTDMGSLTTAAQKATVERHIREALAAGARIACQSAELPGTVAAGGFFHRAVVLEGVDHSMSVMREESFGPLLAVMKVQSDQQAVKLVNDSNLGLTASVWSRQRSHADQLARQLEAGAVTINDHLMSHGMAETPWGGFKESAIGRSHGEPGFREMTQPRVIVHDCLHRLKRNIWWHPYSATVYRGLSGALDAFYADRLFCRLRGLAAVINLYLSRIFKG